MIDYPRKGRRGLRRFLPSWRLVLGTMLLGVLLVVGLFAAAVYFYPIPEPNEIALAEASEVTYTDGQRIGQLGEVTRNSIPLDQIPEHTQQAVITAEDRGFYDHGGFSPVGIARAMVNNLRGGETQGGSTITQQYVKNVFLTFEQSLDRKAKELILSVKLETIESKEDILRNYLNTIYFGRGAYGIEAAAEAYYDRPAADLSISQSAALAAMIRSPGNYEPELFRARLKERWNFVLDGMVNEGYLTEQRRDQTKFPRFAKPPQGNLLGGQTGFLLQSAKQELLDEGFTEGELNGGGLVIETYVNPDAQNALVESVRLQGPGSQTEGLRIGAAAVNPSNGAIVAFYPGPDYLDDQFNNALQARSQAGSTFKPFALAAAFERGVSLNSVWDGNSPRTIDGYTLENLKNTSYGTVSLLKATESSINTPFVDLTSRMGADSVIDAAIRAGVPEDTPGLDKNLTAVLGTASPRPIDMASAYATFAARGMYHEPVLVKKVTDQSGQVIYRAPSLGKPVFDRLVADEVNYALEQVVQSGSGYRARALGLPAAGKTGTTDDNLSAWYVGYTPKISVAVMMTKSDKQGNPVTLRGTGGMTDVTGGSFPAAIWTAFAQSYLAGQDYADFNPPDWSAISARTSEIPGGSAPPRPSPTPSPTPTPTESSSVEPSESTSPEPTPTPDESSPAQTPTDPQDASQSPQPSQSPTDPAGLDPSVTPSPTPSP